MANDYLSYTSRDFNSIKQDLINAIPSLSSVWTNREDADPGMVLLTLMSALGDNLSFNMDKQSLEFFGKTVTQRKNAARLFDLVGYKMHWYKSAKLEVEIFNNHSSPVTLVFNPAGTNTQRLVSNIVTTAPSYFLLCPNETASNWNTNRVITIPAGNSLKLNAIQGELDSLKFSSTAIDVNNRYYLPVSKIDQDHIWLADDKRYQWYLVDSINELTETVPRFEFGVDEYNLPYIEFVPHWRTSFGESHNFTLYYLSTRGSSGAVTTNVLNVIPTLKRINSGNRDFNDGITIVHGSNAYESNNLNNVTGKDPQSAHSAYNDSRNYIGTYNTLVTLIDFENFMKRIPIITQAKAIDGQYAEELNEKLLSSLRKKYREEDGGPAKALHYYDENKITFNKSDVSRDSNGNLYINSTKYITDEDLNADGIVDNTDSIKEHFGFNKHNLQMHMVAGNFQTKSDTDKNLYYAIEEDFNVKVKVKDTNGEYVKDTDGNYVYESSGRGYINYMLTDDIVGSHDDSTISQSGINRFRLYNAELNYAPVRKFPFFINGQIHLKEPMRPAEANLVLYNVYAALSNRFNAVNLTLGEKIDFKDILDTINNADPNIYYFDAGANNKTGALIEYPKVGEFNSSKFNADNLSYEPFGINIDIDYFNDVSLQTYADVMQNNNVLMYFCNTFSNRLTIAESSISIKDNPPVYSTKLWGVIDEPDSADDLDLVITPSINLINETDENLQGEPIANYNKMFRYAIVSQAAPDGFSILTDKLDESHNKILKFYIDKNSDATTDQVNLDDWMTADELRSWPKSKKTSVITYNNYDNTVTTSDNTYIIAAAMLETISTNESAVIFSDQLTIPNMSDDSE